MSDVSSWNPADESNTAAPPDGWPEFMQPSMVNNTGRMMMGAVRRMYDGLAAGSLVLPYLKLAGGQTVTGAVTFSAGLTASAITSTGTINAASTISTGGAISGNTVTANGISSNGNINAAVTYTGGSVNVSGGVSGGSLSTGGAISGNTVTANGITSNGNINAAAAISGNTVTANSISSNGNVSAAGAHTGGSVSVGGNVDCSILVANGRSVYFGPFAEGSLLHNDGGNRKYLQFHPSSAIALQLENSNVVVSSAGLESWIMHPYGCMAVGGPVSGHGGYNDLSDASLKEQIEPAPQGLAEILALKPVTFVRKPRAEGASQRQELGFVAQDVREALPLAVVEVNTTEGPLLGVTSEAIVAALVTALKQIDERLKAGGL